MALPQSAVSDLLEVLRTGEAVDLIRESVRTVLQELVEAEAAEVIGAARYERTDTRVNERNGSRPRTLSTKAGDIDLRIPKLRKGSFFPLILEPRRRIDQALYAVVMEAYVAGVSTRSVDDLVAALGTSPSARCHTSAPAWTRWSPHSAPGGWTPPASSTSTWTRRTSTYATRHGAVAECCPARTPTGTAWTEPRRYPDRSGSPVATEVGNASGTAARLTGAPQRSPSRGRTPCRDGSPSATGSACPGAP
jgi:hypothetical protein